MDIIYYKYINLNLWKLISNKLYFLDCGDDEIKYVSVNNSITLCELCAQIHKNISEIKYHT